jgi:hypothetical protein
VLQGLPNALLAVLFGSTKEDESDSNLGVLGAVSFPPMV